MNACRYKRQSAGTFYRCVAGDCGDVTYMGCTFYQETSDPLLCRWWRLGAICACKDAKIMARITAKTAKQLKLISERSDIR
jgi:hypothetical protein